MNFHPCKITVIGKSYNETLAKAYLKDPDSLGICDIVADGQAFIIENPFIMPDKMCASAWADIRPYILSMASGGKFDFIKDTETTVAICSDPFRPVTFRIERI